MTSERLEVRLDKEHRRKLDELAKARGKPVSSVIRDAIDWVYEADTSKRRRAALDRVRGLAVEDVPDPVTLKRQLDATHDLPDLC